ncbi:17.9 kDa class I heat shock protein-like [Chenopodium quinoa]|uniref:17.9 kDa class I heat shock protein-like n=1 Tax=Chenopodium quinoa TaxID=63459 RepID=UPI000B79A1B9|nr:17.9 kDa class I heat shock protein-like [Chenopodium quinoa]
MRGMVPRTKIEYKETPEAHHFKAQLSGVRKEDVKVKLEEGGRMIHVSAKSTRENEEKKDNYHHVERGYGEFMSKFTLPPNAKPEHMRSSVDNNGVLTITIPKEKIRQSNYQ